MHEKPINANLPIHVCGSCDYKTTNKFNLDKPSESCQKSLEPNSSDHPCDLCQKTFSSKKSLNRHSKLHNKSKSETPSSAASCMVCKKTFLNIWNVERHQKKEHGLTEKGNVVENSAGIAMFTTEALVKETVTEKRTEKIRHRCDQCEYNSYKRLNVRTHMQNKHNGIVKPEMRGRKKKTGTLSERTNRRRKVNNVNNLKERCFIYWKGFKNV